MPAGVPVKTLAMRSCRQWHERHESHGRRRAGRAPGPLDTPKSAFVGFEIFMSAGSNRSTCFRAFWDPPVYTAFTGLKTLPLREALSTTEARKPEGRTWQSNDSIVWAFLVLYPGGTGRHRQWPDEINHAAQPVFSSARWALMPGPRASEASGEDLIERSRTPGKPYRNEGIQRRYPSVIRLSAATGSTHSPRNRGKAGHLVRESRPLSIRTVFRKFRSPEGSGTTAKNTSPVLQWLLTKLFLRNSLSKACLKSLHQVRWAKKCFLFRRRTLLLKFVFTINGQRKLCHRQRKKEASFSSV